MSTNTNYGFTNHSYNDAVDHMASLANMLSIVQRDMETATTGIPSSVPATLAQCNAMRAYASTIIHYCDYIAAIAKLAPDVVAYGTISATYGDADYMRLVCCCDAGNDGDNIAYNRAVDMAAEMGATIDYDGRYIVGVGTPLGYYPTERY